VSVAYLPVVVALPVYVLTKVVQLGGRAARRPVWGLMVAVPLVWSGLGVGLVARGSSTDHTKNAKAVFARSEFGASYRVEKRNEDPGDPGSVSYDLRFDRTVDLRAIHPPAGYRNRCGDGCDAAHYDGPEPGTDDERCEMFVMRMAQATLLKVLISCEPAYGDP